MRFQPQTEAEISEGSLLPKGDYTFEVLEAVEKTSKASGNDMIALKIGVHHNDSVFGVFDYLVAGEKTAYKVRHFADAIGMIDQYEAGSLDASELVGKAGKCKIDTQAAQNGYAAKNVVRDYIKRGESAVSSKPKSKTDDDLNDPIPW